jgi:hypothetical protein
MNSSSSNSGVSSIMREQTGTNRCVFKESVLCKNTGTDSLM